MLVSDLDFDLPQQAIAQQPLPERDASRMLLLERNSGLFDDRYFSELPELLRGDELMVVNNARVIPARLFGYRAGLNALPPGKENPARHNFLRSRIEVLLIRHVEGNLWEALVRPGRKIRVGERIAFGEAVEGDSQSAQQLQAEVVGRGELGLRMLRFYGVEDLSLAIENIGHVPLPPYIRRADDPADRERYQTIFAKHAGSVAAPTAGLHFTASLLKRLEVRGIEMEEITLEVGLGTFQPVHTENLEDHKIHSEAYEIPQKAANAIAKARRDRRPILAVGTTVVRALEAAAAKTASATGQPGAVEAGRALADIFIVPGRRFAVIDQLLTNFHLPRSSLLALVAAFGGREAVLHAYKHAVESGYRFYSYGDCMLIR